MAGVDSLACALQQSLKLDENDFSTLEELIMDDICKNWIKPINIQKEIPLSSFTLKDYFKKVADVVLDNEVTTKGKKARNTVIKFEPLDKDAWKREVEFVYLIVANGNIIKIGGTRKGMKGRAESYLCGHHIQERQKSGRCSVTNAYVYNTLHFYIKHGINIEIYAYEIEPVIVNVEVFGQIRKISAQVYQAFEAQCLEEYKKQIGRYPILSDNADPKYKN